MPCSDTATKILLSRKLMIAMSNFSKRSADVKRTKYGKNAVSYWMKTGSPLLKTSLAMPSTPITTWTGNFLTWWDKVNALKLIIVDFCPSLISIRYPSLKVFRHSLSETIKMVFNRLKSDFILVRGVLVNQSQWKFQTLIYTSWTLCDEV